MKTTDFGKAQHVSAEDGKEKAKKPIVKGEKSDVMILVLVVVVKI